MTENEKHPNELKFQMNKNQRELMYWLRYKAFKYKTAPIRSNLSFDKISLEIFSGYWKENRKPKNCQVLQRKTSYRCNHGREKILFATTVKRTLRETDELHHVAWDFFPCREGVQDRED